jgi:hypothetical protein
MHFSYFISLLAVPHSALLSVQKSCGARVSDDGGADEAVLFSCSRGACGEATKKGLLGSYVSGGGCLECPGYMEHVPRNKLVSSASIWSCSSGDQELDMFFVYHRASGAVKCFSARDMIKAEELPSISTTKSPD